MADQIRAIVEERPGPAPGSLPQVREARLTDQQGLAAMHLRCTSDTLYRRYQAPLKAPITRRMARRLVSPESGIALVAKLESSVIGHAVVMPANDTWHCQLIVEDAWQGRGVGTMLVKAAAAHAKFTGSQRLTFITAGSNERLLRVIGASGFAARVERHLDNLHITVPLTEVRGVPAG